MLIVGIEPKAPGLHIFGQKYLPRLGLPQLLTIAQGLGHTCEIYCEEITPIDWPRMAEADIILVSSLTSTAPRAYSLVHKIRELNPSAPILVGGPHVTFLPEEALSEGADYVFRHEADESFPQWLAWWNAGRDPRGLFSIEGLSFRIGNQYHHTVPPSRLDLDTLPTPDLGLIVGYDRPEVINLITSRGCPYNCDFCSEIAMFGRQYRFRSEEKVMEDIRYYQERYGELDIFFADDNFAANPIRLRRLCQALIDSKLVRDCSAQVRLDLARHPDDVALMRRAGFERVYVGYESTNDQSLVAIGKGFTYADMKHYTKVFHENGIMIHAMWVLGFDDDDLETVKKTVKTTIRLGIETTQFLILVPIPGAALYERFKREGRIFCTNWSRYDGHHVTFYPKGMTARQLQIAVMLEAMPRFYNVWLTGKIFVVNNLRTMTRFIRFKTQHPFRELRSSLRSSLMTLLARLWGNGATRKMKKPIREYLKQIP